MLLFVVCNNSLVLLKELTHYGKLGSSNCKCFVVQVELIGIIIPIKIFCVRNLCIVVLKQRLASILSLGKD